MFVCGFRSLNVGGLDSGGLDSGGRKEMESYLLGRSPRTKPHQAAGEEEWKATSSGEALEQSQFKLQAKGNGKLLPRAEPSHKTIPSCKEPRCGGLLPRAEPSHKAIPSCKEPTCASRAVSTARFARASRTVRPTEFTAPRTVRSTGII